MTSQHFQPGGPTFTERDKLNKAREADLPRFTRGDKVRCFLKKEGVNRQWVKCKFVALMPKKDINRWYVVERYVSAAQRQPGQEHGKVEFVTWDCVSPKWDA
jgi:hypothetical protein